MQRRTYLKTLGTTGIAAAGVGFAAMTGSATPSSQLSIGDGDAGTVTNDTGDVSEVFVKPKLRVDWEGFDETVDKIRVLVEARLERNDAGAVLPAWENEVDDLRQDIYDALGNNYGGYPLLKDSYVPVFRETPWLFNDEYFPEKFSASGTSGSFSKNGNRVPVYSRASELTNRQDSYFKANSIPASEIPPIMLFSEQHQRPDYAGLPGSDSGVNENPGQYLSGISISGGGNFLNGSYGAAGDTSLLDNTASETTTNVDGTTATNRIGLRFTVSLRHDDPSVNADPLAMNGFDGLPSHDEDGDPSQAWQQFNRGYAGLQSIAGSHPAVMVDRAQVKVDARNEAATASGSGRLGANAN
jgi:hypothetical protein